MRGGGGGNRNLKFKSELNFDFQSIIACGEVKFQTTCFT